MNVGQRLVQLSGLPSGSALAHFAAIVQGSGSGQTIFAHRFGVTTSQQTMAVSDNSQPGKVVFSAPAFAEKSAEAVFVREALTVGYIRSEQLSIGIRKETQSLSIESPLESVVVNC